MDIKSFMYLEGGAAKFHSQAYLAQSLLYCSKLMHFKSILY